ncbi:MAG TPA: hypothetical protein VNT54_14580 [Solirubrobacteraceae bacterium]|nr:hypothetical protein [Solirubrobacteraceae bacterium]
MTLWWIGNIILIAVVIPVVIAILVQVLTPIFQIRQYAEEITEYGAQFPGHLDDIAGELVKTRELVKAAGPELGRYARAIDNL